MTVVREIEIVNKLGLHARAATKLVKTAAGFASDIRLRNGAREADAKSIMSVMMLAAGQGTVLELEADGPDAEAAVRAIAELVADRFGEPE